MKVFFVGSIIQKTIVESWYSCSLLLYCSSFLPPDFSIYITWCSDVWWLFLWSIFSKNWPLYSSVMTLSLAIFDLDSSIWQNRLSLLFCVSLKLKWVSWRPHTVHSFLFLHLIYAATLFGNSIHLYSEYWRAKDLLIPFSSCFVIPCSFSCCLHLWIIFVMVCFDVLLWIYHRFSLCSY